MAWPGEAGSLGIITPQPGKTRRPAQRPMAGSAAMVSRTPYRPVKLTINRIGANDVQITADSFLSGDIYYYWYQDGAYIGSRLNINTYTFRVPDGEQARIDCLDTNNADFDPLAHAPDGFPARRNLYWPQACGDNSDDIDYYLVQEKIDGGSWTDMGHRKHHDSVWTYQLLTGRYDTESSVEWQVIAYDLAGNAGTPFALGAEEIWRTEDGPDFNITYNTTPDTVTFAENT